MTSPQKPAEYLVYNANCCMQISTIIATHADNVFVRSEFAQFGTPPQLSRALNRLIESCALVRLGVGVYAKAKSGTLSGAPIPVRPLDVLAPIALRKREFPGQRLIAVAHGADVFVLAGDIANGTRVIEIS
jgi:hypothetical protein